MKPLGTCVGEITTFALKSATRNNQLPGLCHVKGEELEREERVPNDAMSRFVRQIMRQSM
jgi:hypothetical protein